MSTREQGLTVIELLVAATLAVIVIALALSMVLSSRNVFSLDRARTNVNQNLRSAMDIVTADIRQAGERVGPTVPAITVQKSSTGGDTLTLQRNLLDTTLPVCKDISAGSSADAVVVADASIGKNHTNPNLACKGKDNKTKSKWDSGAVTAINAWETYRQENGVPNANSSGKKAFQAYIYDPQTGQGEYFYVDATDSSQMHIHRENGYGAWKHTYKASDQAFVYVKDQRVYSLDTTNHVLQLTVNDGNPQNVVAGIDSFTVDTYMQKIGGGTFLNDQSGLTKGALSQATPSGTCKANSDYACPNWQQVAYIQVQLNGTESDGGKNVTRQLVDHATPRNVLSSPNATQ